MLAIFFKPKINIKLPSPGVWTGNGQGHKVVKSSQKLQERERERESSWMKIAGFWVPKVHFSGLERPLWQTGVMSPEGGAHLHQPQRGRSRNPGATWGTCWPLPKQGNAWSHRGHFWCWQPFQEGRRESGAHTKTCNVLSANTIFQKARSLNV